MDQHQHRGWISCSPTAEHPCHSRLSPDPRLSPMLWLSPPSSTAAVAAPCPHGWECWLGGFFVSIFGNPGRAVPHPQAFGIRDGKFHLWGRYGNEQSWEGGLWRKTTAAGGAPKASPLQPGQPSQHPKGAWHPANASGWLLHSHSWPLGIHEMCQGQHLPGDQLRSSCSLPRGAASGICLPTLG